MSARGPRYAAREAGLLTYFTGKPCPKGHVAERRVHNGACAECEAVAKRVAYEKNRDSALMRAQKYRDANRAQINEKAAARRKADPEKHRQAAARYRERNADAVRARWVEAYKNGLRDYYKKKYVENRDRMLQADRLRRKLNPGVEQARCAKRRAHRMSATPLWADDRKITAVYTRMKALRKAGFDVEVDRIIPLKSKLVCGLHVHWNLRIIPMPHNRSKSNSFVEADALAFF